MPQQSESGLGSDEYTNVTTVVSDLANPEPAAKKRKTRGQYTKYSDADCAKLGRYASKHGIERARRLFLGDFLHLTESTVRNVKKLYLQKLRDERKKADPQPVTKLAVKPRGRPPILPELDTKLLNFLKAVRSKGGIINIHVVRSTASALINSNPALA